MTTAKTPAPRTTLNLISGFLGAGKTSAILHLLRHHPAGERWAVLVNEFGEVGIDGGVLEDAGGGIPVREVSGGCICCTGAMNLRVALTRLLREVRPDRLLLEPTGLGHPAGIVDTLRDPWLAGAVRLGNIITLVDPSGFSQERLEQSLIYADQLSLADVVVLNKTDVAPEERIRALEAHLAGLYPPKLAVVRTTRGALDPALLDLEGRARPGGAFTPVQPGAASAEAACPLTTPGLPDHGQAPQADTARGWCFPPELIFDRKGLEALFAAPPFHTLTRAKGVLRTGREWQRLDWAEGRLEITPITWRRDSRLELIAPEDAVPDWTDVETRLRAVTRTG
ncbi:GTPase, G3E family [Ectothiorhodospira mobilis]|uniref:GTPase, G3E family n=1 Tax=Ectothiorhodospira mobilis TaxID=195064 RepID=A0A1I4P990_ECTMO|nr:GTP-binding protein [Ectothiorhodospira mobilis]SFM24117.1 GTPase, G3E family [Ectothiorhodospira mobilis]